ncbi:MAG: hypothetical protein U5R31_09335 [Acidimicrobiia bacterium]|nr:hypothetical protein [Acidimicrobiia bacterium]
MAESSGPDTVPTRPDGTPILSEFERRVELIAAILLSIATVATAWSAFQATKWGGVMAIEFSNANAARTEATAASDAAGQFVGIDVQLFTQWLNAYEDGNQELAQVYERRFREDFKPAFEAWWAMDPFENPESTQVPFQMEEYHLPEEQQAIELTAEADEASEAARVANQRGDNYVLTTVLFASVLFFAGVSGKFNARRAKIITLVMASGILVIGIGLIATFPVQL